MSQTGSRHSYSYDGRIRRKTYKREAKWYGYGEERMDYSEYTYEGREGHQKVKRQIYCPKARKCKLRFDEERQANNFIKYNSAEILATKGYAPVRSYFCYACGGWHVTSHLFSLDSPTRDSNRIFDNKLETLPN